MLNGTSIGNRSLSDQIQVLGHRRALTMACEAAKAHRRIDAKFLRLLDHMIFCSNEQHEGCVPFTFRENQCKIGHRKLIFPHPAEVFALMTRLCTWLYSEEAQVMHPIDRASTFHCRLLRIHPFFDGNGRTARTAM
jgi:Fic family protein